MLICNCGCVLSVMRNNIYYMDFERIVHLRIWVLYCFTPNRTRNFAYEFLTVFSLACNEFEIFTTNHDNLGIISL